MCEYPSPIIDLLTPANCISPQQSRCLLCDLPRRNRRDYEIINIYLLISMKTVSFVITQHNILISKGFSKQIFVRYQIWLWIKAGCERRTAPYIIMKQNSTCPSPVLLIITPLSFEHSRAWITYSRRSTAAAKVKYLQDCERRTTHGWSGTTDHGRRTAGFDCR